MLVSIKRFSDPGATQAFRELCQLLEFDSEGGAISQPRGSILPPSFSAALRNLRLAALVAGDEASQRGRGYVFLESAYLPAGCRQVFRY